MPYDPDFGTEEDAALIHNAIPLLAEKIQAVEPDPTEILDVVKGKPGKSVEMKMSERDAKVLRFALGLALETF